MLKGSDANGKLQNTTQLFGEEWGWEEGAPYTSTEHLHPSWIQSTPPGRGRGGWEGTPGALASHLLDKDYSRGRGVVGEWLEVA